MAPAAPLVVAPAARAPVEGPLVPAGVGPGAVAAAGWWDPGPAPRESRAPDPSPSPTPPASPRQRGVVRALARLELLAMAGAITAVTLAAAHSYRASLARADVVPGVRLAGAAVGGLAPAQLEPVAHAQAARALDRQLTLRADGAELTRTARALGAEPAPLEAVHAVTKVGRSGELLADLRAREAARAGEIDIPVGQRFDETRALAALLELAPAAERPSLPPRLDLAARKVLPAAPGAALLPFDSLSALAVGLASGVATIDLPVLTKPPAPDPWGGRLDGLVIDEVLGSFETPYPRGPDDRDRNHNLKVGAAALDGTVIWPGERLSFNAVVGERSAEQGYRYATGIESGELVDVLGGGICQVSSTLFGAAFFAGLEVVSARPHSRPSSYVDMGLDSTVVWPDVDLVLRNDFDFPVVVHLTAVDGVMRGEILGPRRPYDKVVFERQLTETHDYGTVWRDDPSLRVGTQTVAQQGKRGFTVQRRRIALRGGEEVDRDEWRVHYPATQQIIRRGTSPTGAVPAPQKLLDLRDPAPTLRIAR